MLNDDGHMTQYSFVGDPPKRLQVTAPVKGVPTQFDITNEMKTACEKPWWRLSRKAASHPSVRTMGSHTLAHSGPH